MFIKKIKEVFENIRFGTMYKEEWIKARDLSEKMSTYASVLERHVQDRSVIKCTGKTISDYELNTKVLVLGDNAILHSLDFSEDEPAAIVVHPRSKNVIIQNCRIGIERDS